MRSSKHNQNKEKLISENLRKHNSDTHLRGETLPEEQQVYRVMVVSAFLKAGVPLNKTESLLEENAFCLTDHRNIYDYVTPFIRGREHCKYLSVIFDGTSRVGGALAILFYIMLMTGKYNVW